MKKEDMGRGNFVKLLTISSLSALACRLPSLLVENLGNTLSFKNELENATIEMNWDTLARTADRYAIPKKNLRDLSIVVTNDRVSPGNFMGDAWHVSTICSEAGSGNIKVAGGAVIEEVERRIEDHLHYDEEYVRHTLPSHLLSHAVFLGFAQLAEARGLFISDSPFVLAELYYNQLASGGESQPFLNAVVTL